MCRQVHHLYPPEYNNYIYNGLQTNKLSKFSPGKAKENPPKGVKPNSHGVFTQGIPRGGG